MRADRQFEALTRRRFAFLPNRIAKPELALALLMSGVAGACRTLPTSLDVSAPQAIPAGVLGKIDPDGSTTLFLGNLDLVIEVRNHRMGRTGVEWGLLPIPFPPFFVPIPTTVPVEAESTGPEDGVPLLLFLKFTPRREGFAFRPGDVVVTSEEPGAFHVVAMTGPVDDSCAGTEGEADTAPREYDLPPHVVTCFVLRFPLVTSPDLEFRLSLSGLSSQGVPMTPVNLRYRKFSGNLDP